jgi:hypothetical protein
VRLEEHPSRLNREFSKFLGSSTAPEIGLRISRVGDPLAVERDLQFSCGDAPQKGHKLLRFAVITDHLDPRLVADDK